MTLPSQARPGCRNQPISLLPVAAGGRGSLALGPVLGWGLVLGLISAGLVSPVAAARAGAASSSATMAGHTSGHSGSNDGGGHGASAIKAAAVLDSHIDPAEDRFEDLEADDRQAVIDIATYGAARRAALALPDPMAQEVALQKAQARLAAAFGQPALSNTELVRINTLIDQNGR